MKSLQCRTSKTLRIVYLSSSYIVLTSLVCSHYNSIRFFLEHGLYIYLQCRPVFRGITLASPTSLSLTWQRFNCLKCRQKDPKMYLKKFDILDFKHERFSPSTAGRFTLIDVNLVKNVAFLIDLCILWICERCSCFLSGRSWAWRAGRIREKV